MGVSDRSLVSPSSMRAFIVCLAIASVSGDAKPYTVKQVAEGLPVKNAIADRRLHNVGVITNAAEAGVTKSVLSLSDLLMPLLMLSIHKLLLMLSTPILPIPILSTILAREKLSPTPWDKLLLPKLLVEKSLPLTLDMELDSSLPRLPLTLLLSIQLSMLVLPR